MFNRDGTHLLVVSDAGATVHDVQTGETLAVLQAQTGLLTDAQFSADGHWVVTTSVDRTTTLWDARSWQMVYRLERGSRFYSIAAARAGGQVAVGEARGSIGLWDLDRGRVSANYPGHNRRVTAVSFTADGKHLASGSVDGHCLVWSLERGAKVADLHHDGSPDRSPISTLALDEKGSLVVAGSGDFNSAPPDRRVFVWNLLTGQPVRIFEANASERNCHAVAVSPAGDKVIAGTTSGHVIIWDATSGRTSPGQRLGTFRAHPNGILAIALAPESTRLATVGWDNVCRVWKVPSGTLINELKGHRPGTEGTPFAPSLLGDRGETKNCTTAVAFDASGQLLLTGGSDKQAILWDVNLGTKRRILDGHTDQITGVAFTSNSRFAVTSSLDGSVRVWDSQTGADVCSLYGYQTSNWAVVAPDGRFDVTSLEDTGLLHWVFPDDPLHALPLEVFMRDYYEPRLLPRLLEGQQFPLVRPLMEANRVQPKVERLEVGQGAAEHLVNVTVSVSGTAGSFRRSGKDVTMLTDVYDLRLFRDGRVVGQWPMPKADSDRQPEPDSTSQEQMQAWRDANRIKADGEHVKAGLNGKLTVSFPVRLASRHEDGPVEFTAYAFNEDRVKSETARITFTSRASPAQTLPRAYLIAMGVSASEHQDWNLRFAAADARLTVAAIGRSLEATHRYEVIPIVLTSEADTVGRPIVATATKDNVRAVLQLLAGREIPAGRRVRLPQADRVRTVTPDDLVLFAFSGHGYTDARGNLHLLPYDVGRGRQEMLDVLPRCISSADLAAWLRDVDAGEFVLILDACHAAAAGAPPGFKPGPLGSRGLAQLAYDKGMRVLAASQADDVALESEKIQHGLLTYALIRDGLEGHRAEQEGQLTLGGLLAYAADRVPTLYEKILSGDVKDVQGRQVAPIKPQDGERSRVQRPELFDYAGKRSEIVLLKP